MKPDLLKSLRDGEQLSSKQLIRLILNLSIPAILAQISSIVMQYIDASMVGHLGSNQAAAIGLVGPSTWLMGSMIMAITIGFTVQTAQAIGAKENEKARSLVRLGLVTGLILSSVLLVIGVLISGNLPIWLGGGASIVKDASNYFLVFALIIPLHQMNSLAGGMLQSSGNMKLPSMLHILMCILDVIFNAILIFPEIPLQAIGIDASIPGADLGVVGAALGTACAELVVAPRMLYSLLVRSPILHLRKSEHLVISREYLKNALKIASPIGFEQLVMNGAQIASIIIVAPLGTVALAANTLSITAESLCYMPGYGIAAAATTLIGQSIGARRFDLTQKLGWMTTGLGMGIMALSGGLMFIFAPEMIGILTSDPEVRRLGTTILRIEAIAEPMYGASIVASGVFRGAGDTLIPSGMNLVSMWAVRIPLAALLAGTMGLEGVWIAMCSELCFRGTIFLG